MTKVHPQPRAFVRTVAMLLCALLCACLGRPAVAQGAADPARLAGQRLPEAVQGAQSPALRAYLVNLQARLGQGGDAAARQALAGEITNALAVAEQMRARGGAYPLGAAPLSYFSVPAMSPIKRLPTTLPPDGELAGPLRIIAARNEFEPASLVVFPFTSVSATLTATDLTGPGGPIPAASVDLKVVKCWYQTGTGWYSYFADCTGKSLVPELLLNDETLITVDTTTRDNYLRVEAPEGRKNLWISNPTAVQTPFNAETTPVADAKTLQPFQLVAGECKQFWVTVKVPQAAAPGLYTGSLRLTAGNAPAVAIPLTVRVLPFELPTPMTNYDLTREYYTMLYNEPHYADILKACGGDTAHADRKMLALYENMRDHNILNPLFADFRPDAPEAFIRELEIVKQAGISTNPLFGGVPGIPAYGWMTSPAVKGVPLRDQPMPDDLIKKIDDSYAIVEKLLGHKNIYCFGWDEPGMGLLVAERKPWKYIHDKGLKTYSTGHDGHLKFAGYNEDFCNCPGEPTRERADKWHAMGARVTNYAGPHTGPENPDFMRRVHGLQLYKANYDGIGNYILSCTGWNDFLGEEYNYRGFNMTYPTQNGVIDTLEWEGMREAIDDVRYATKLKQLAQQAIATGKTEAVYTGKRALQWLELLDEKHADLNAARLEMINYLLQLQAVQ